MAFSTFTVTEVTYNFTATVNTPLELALVGTETNIIVTNSTATVSVINSRQPVTVNGVGSNTFNQSLNTTDNVQFDTLTVSEIYGSGGSPVSFPTGISAANFGTVFSGTLDFGLLFGTYTNIISLLFAALPVDMGTILLQPQYSVDLGTI